jgi:hypothetical protein
LKSSLKRIQVGSIYEKTRDCEIIPLRALRRKGKM